MDGNPDDFHKEIQDNAESNPRYQTSIHDPKKANNDTF